MRQAPIQQQAGKLSLSQQMRLSLDLLRMDAGRLSRRIGLELARNPALTCADPDRLHRTVGPRDALAAQIGLLRLPAERMRIARDLVHCLDDRGLLADPLPEIAGWLGTTAPVLEDLLPHLHQLEPAGVFARDIAECFRLQLRAKDRLDPWIDRLLDRLDLVASGNLAAIAAYLGTDREDARDILADIRALSPSPLGGAEPDGPPPELLLSRQGAALNPAAFPRLAVTGSDGAARAAATAFVDATARREATLLAIGRAILTAQEAFFRSGSASDLKPLSMTGLAWRIGLHKSTVSRAVSGCLARTDWGVMECRAFFPPAATARMPEVPRNRILTELAALLADRAEGARMSDADLTARLAGAGYPVARRTVAKYRRMLAGPPA